MKDEKSEPEDLRSRTKRYGLAIVQLYVCIPGSRAAQVMAGQLLRSGTSIGAHYRESCRARSDAEFVSKIELALQELDETAYWLEVLTESKTYIGQNAFDVLIETNELIRIFVTIVKRRKEQR